MQPCQKWIPAKKKKNIMSRRCYHYRISILRRVPGAHGEAPQAHDKDFTKGHTRRSADDNYRHGKGRVCRVPNFGHTANNFAVYLSRYTAQKSKKTA